MGVSGGEEGARHGPALMPGGQEEAYRLVEPVLDAIAAKVDGQPCCGYIGKGGAGHYVKMVHNGIEYAIMQLICEAYDVMRRGLGMSPAEMRAVFALWNAGDMNSYLLEITAAVLGKTDPDTGKPMVDVILDRAGQKGTGKWTSQNAMDLGVAIPTINAALEARILSAVKDERVAASHILHGPELKLEGDRQEHVAILRDAYQLAAFTGVRAGLFAVARGLQRVRVRSAFRRDRQDLARRLHHPREDPEPHARHFRRAARPGEPDDRRRIRAHGRPIDSQPAGRRRAGSRTRNSGAWACAPRSATSIATARNGFPKTFCKRSATALAPTATNGWTGRAASSSTRSGWSKGSRQLSVVNHQLSVTGCQSPVVSGRQGWATPGPRGIKGNVNRGY